MAFNFMNTIHRFWAYLLLFMLSAALLGLTADRIHRTRTLADTYEPVVVELLVGSVLALIWSPIAMMSVRHKQADAAYVRSKHMRELGGDAFLWLFFLIGSSIYTNRILPGQNYCGFQGETCRKLTAILAISWSIWGLLTIIIVLALLHHAAATTYRPAGVTTHNGARV